MIRFQIQLGRPGTAELEEGQRDNDSRGDAEPYRGWCCSSTLQADINVKGPADNSVRGFKASTETSSLPSDCFGCVPEGVYSPARL